jgi:hypothetical protein
VSSPIPASRVALIVIGSAPDAQVARIAALATASQPSKVVRAVGELALLNELFAVLTAERIRVLPLTHEDAQLELVERWGRTPGKLPFYRSTPI